MRMADAHAVEVLNGLLTSAYDSADGFRTAAGMVRNPQFQALFTERAQGRDGLAGEIEAEVRTFGGEPTRDGSLLAGAHRAFTQVRSLIDRGSDKAVVEEVARGEAFVQLKFDEAAADAQLPEAARQLAGRAGQTLKDQHTEIVALVDQYR
jgi:uncharacterized protein (TIGR02284 family)